MYKLTILRSGEAPEHYKPRLPYDSLADARRSAKVLSMREEATVIVKDADREVVAVFQDGIEETPMAMRDHRRRRKKVSASRRPMRRVRRATKRRRDVSRADLRHLSGAALLKLLRQAVRNGDEDMAEAIGKELDRRSKF